MSSEAREAAAFPPEKKKVPRLVGPGPVLVGKPKGAPYRTTVNAPVSFSHAETSWSEGPSPVAAVSASASPLTTRLLPSEQIGSVVLTGAFDLVASSARVATCQIRAAEKLATTA